MANFEIYNLPQKPRATTILRHMDKERYLQNEAHTQRIAEQRGEMSFESLDPVVPEATLIYGFFFFS